MVTRHALSAMHYLVRIYEIGHDWPQAIKAVKKLSTLTNEPVSQHVHYYCEQAEMALASTPPDFTTALNALDNAQVVAEQLGSHCTVGAKARIALLRGLWSQKKQNPEQQRNELAPILNFAPNYAGLMADALLQAYQQLDQADEGLQVLIKHYELHPNLDVFNVLFKALRTQQGPVQAWHFARQSLRRTPSLLALDRILEVELSLQEGKRMDGAVQDIVENALTKEIAAGADLGLLRSLIHRHTQRLDRYACRECGFETKQYYWQCPGCNHWESYLPLRLEELQ